MKKYGIIFCLFSFTMMAFACSTLPLEIPVNWVENNKVSIAWDPGSMKTNSGRIDEGEEIKYLVYIHFFDKREWELIEKYVDGVWVDKDTPITVTSCNLQFKEKGQFVVGVQSVLVDKGNIVKGQSRIAWSDNNQFTNNTPFAVRVEE